MKIWIVSETDYDIYNQYGLFSTREKAQAYIDMVDEARQKLGRGKSYYDLDEYDVDDLADHQPIFAISIMSWDARRKDESVLYRARVPKTELHGDPISTVKIFGRDLEKLRAQVPEARKHYFGK